MLQLGHGWMGMEGQQMLEGNFSKNHATIRTDDRFLCSYKPGWG